MMSGFSICKSFDTATTIARFGTGRVSTQQVLNWKHLGFAVLKDTFFLAASLLARGRTNFVRMLWKFSSVYNVKRQISDHSRVVKYPITLRARQPTHQVDQKLLFIHKPDPGPGQAKSAAS